MKTGGRRKMKAKISVEKKKKIIINKKRDSFLDLDNTVRVCVCVTGQRNY